MRQFSVLLYANLLSSVRNRTAVFFNLISPLLFFLIFGLVFAGQSAGNSVPYALYLMPGIIVASQLSSGLFGSAAVLVTWRERGIFRRMRATPMPPWQLLLARVLVQVLIVTIQAAIVIVVGQLLFQVHPATSGWAWTVLFILAGALTFQVLGQLVAARARRMETANIFINIIFLPLLFFTDLYLPITLLPDWLQQVGKLLPPYLVVDLLRSAMVAGTTPAHAVAEIVGLAVYFVLALAISARIFRFE